MLTLRIILLMFVINVYKCFEFKRVCYYTTWSNHLQEKAALFQISDIDPHLCTHVIFAFADFDEKALRLVKSQVDDDNGELQPNAKGKYFDFTKLKETNPNLKTLLSIGGQRKSETLHLATESFESQYKFAENCRKFLRDRNFDGLDIDWEFPGIYKNKFTELLQVVRTEFESDAIKSNKPRLLLTIAGAQSKETIDESYNITEIVKYLDFINVMTYDYYGAWSSVTGFTGPLFSRYSDAAFKKEYSQNWTMHYWIQQGAPPEMLVMGTTATATAFTLNDPSQHDVGSPVKVHGGPEGPFRKMKGQLSYYEVCHTILAKGGIKVWDNEQKMNYAYLGDQWVGYNDPRSLTEKVKYAKSIGLGGIMFWTFDLDDFSGKFCGQGKFPLLQAISSAALNGNYTRAPTTQHMTPVITTTKSEIRTTVSTTTSMSSLQTKTSGNQPASSISTKRPDNQTDIVSNSTEVIINEATSYFVTTQNVLYVNQSTLQEVEITTQTPRPAFKLYIIQNGTSGICFCKILFIITSVLLLR